MVTPITADQKTLFYKSLIFILIYSTYVTDFTVTATRGTRGTTLTLPWVCSEMAWLRGWGHGQCQCLRQAKPRHWSRPGDRRLHVQAPKAAGQLKSQRAKARRKTATTAPQPQPLNTWPPGPSGPSRTKFSDGMCVVFDELSSANLWLWFVKGAMSKDTNTHFCAMGIVTVMNSLLRNRCTIWITLFSRLILKCT